MPKQPAFPVLRDAMKKKQTRREVFLSEMEAVVPWGRLLGLVTPHHPKAGPKGGRPPMPIETMLRVFFLQNWYAQRSNGGGDALRQRGYAPFRRDRVG
jgi:IS5 family transposase